MTWKVIREAKRRLERERGTIVKDWGGKIPIALIYPNSYYLGMSSLGFQTIYKCLNNYENVVCERVFWEPKKASTEEPIALESQRPLSDFDILAFSIYYELDYFNVVRILHSCNIPLLSAERDESHPLILAGGPCITANPQPLSLFFDGFAIGEAEAILPELIHVLPELIESKRDNALYKLTSINGIYVPALYNNTPVKRQWLADLDSVATTSTILTPDTDLSDMFVIEIARGCVWGCRFCLAGFCFRPFRHRSKDNLLRQAKEGLKYGKRIGLLASAVSDHPEIDELSMELTEIGAELSVSSLRIRPLSDILLRELARSGSQGVTLAPEAGSERLRRVIKKGINEDDIIKATEHAIEQGLKQIKLYFMIGLPTETDDDIEEMVELTLKIKSRIERSGGRLALTIAPFVPKAHTPFQCLPMADEEILNRRVMRLRNALTKQGIEIRTDSVSWSLVQGVLARGDARLAQPLAHMSRPSLKSWHQALNKFDLSADDYVYHTFSSKDILPWSIIDCGITRDYLQGELDKALKG